VIRQPANNCRHGLLDISSLNDYTGWLKRRPASQLTGWEDHVNFRRFAMTVLLLVAVPSVAFAQASIAAVVRDQLDVRFAKILKVRGNRRLQVSFDLYNALNSNVGQTYNADYNPTGAWRVPLGILPARLTNVSGQFDF
jgi:hypothetical protein